MSTIIPTMKLDRSSGPASEPVSLAEAKDHCEIIETDTSHNTKLTRFIQAAREQLEQDTDLILVNQTYTQSMDAFPSEPFRLMVRPVSSITSITYYDGSNVQQTLSTDVYGIDTGDRLVYLKYNQSWPSITQQHNGIVITFVSGFGATEANVAMLCKQAILLQVAKWFIYRGDEVQVHGKGTYDAAYESVLKRIMRTSYP